MRRFSLGLLVVALSSACAFLPGRPTASDCPARPTVSRQRAYGLIHPLLDLDDSIEFHELRPFLKSLRGVVDGAVKAGRASEVSVYFRDLNNGYWTGVAERAEFSPASLLKLPLLMTVLDRAEEEPEFLKRRLVYDAATAASFTVTTEFPSRSPLNVGEAYTVGDLMRRMILDSDNGAALLLFGAMPSGSVEKAYSDLGIEGAPGAGAGAAVTVKQYAMFFRVLYNASYLDRRASQTALELLAGSHFLEGLVAGVPAGATVAHKFGERHDIAGGAKQLHDCGIVYHPDTPYLLCVMTRGAETKALAGVIAQTSRFVWDEISRQAELRAGRERR